MEHRQRDKGGGRRLPGAGFVGGLFAALGVVVLVTGLATGSDRSSVAAEPRDRVQICHYDRNQQGPNAGPHVIEISENALEQHLANHVKKDDFAGDDFVIESEADLARCKGMETPTSTVAADTPTATNTSMATATNTPTDTATATATATELAETPTATATATELAETPTATATATELAETPTATPTATEVNGIIVETATPTIEAAAVSPITPQVVIVEQEAVSDVGLPPAAVVEDVEGIVVVPEARVLGVQALPSTGSGSNSGQSPSQLAIAGIGMIALGIGLLITSWRLRRAS